MNEIRRLELLLVMRKNGLNAAQVGEMLGVRPQTVRCWMSDIRNTPEGTHKRIREQLKARRQPTTLSAA